MSIKAGPAEVVRLPPITVRAQSFNGNRGVDGDTPWTDRPTGVPGVPLRR
jgi:hypothetical protein